MTVDGISQKFRDGSLQYQEAKGKRGNSKKINSHLSLLGHMCYPPHSHDPPSQPALFTLSATQPATPNSPP